MPRLADQPLPFQDCTVLSLRPRGQHASLRAACARQGASLLALSPIAITPLDTADTRARLAEALAANTVIVTSPNAVTAMQALHPLQTRCGQTWLAVGTGTARALGRRGIPAIAPPRMDSEGLLGLPSLAHVQGQRIGLITAPGGRGLLQPALEARGAQVLRAHVYARRAIAIPAHRWHRLTETLQQPRLVVLALSSDDALQAWRRQLPAALVPALQDIAVAAASARLADSARAAGFLRIGTAASARPAALLATVMQLRQSSH